LIFAAQATAIGKLIPCGEYRSENNPNKLTYKFQVSSEYSQDYESFFKKVGKIPVEEVSRYYELIDRGTFIYKKGFANMSMRGDDGKVIIEHQTIQPSFALKVGDSTIIGFSNGEFGGELLRVANDDSIHHLAEINVEDISGQPHESLLINHATESRCQHSFQIIGFHPSTLLLGRYAAF
jgi:hypothetical protein